MRGWRIRKDLTYGAPPLIVGGQSHPSGIWGSFPWTERYVIQGDRLYDKYRVGALVVGCNGVLVKPSFFTSDIFQAPTDTHFLLNDAWNNGNMANHSIERWVVPMLGTDTMGTHLGQHATVIDHQIRNKNRGAGNTMMFHYFKDAWEKDLWYSDMDSPPLKGFWPLRHWFSENVILYLHCFRWIRNLVGDFRVP